ncbi:hypothetical protein ACFE04_018649 [Oxalis oulophora]
MKRSEDQTIRKGPWKVEEDEVLINHVKKYGPRDWSSIRSKGLLQRTGKSCRLRWVNKLRPNLKNGCKFSLEEERIVIELQAEYGNKWAKIATYLNGRTDNDVKNFWSSRQKRLARILQNSGTSSSSSSSSNPKPLKMRREVVVLPVQAFPNPEVKKLNPSMEEEPTSETRSYSPTYLADTKALKMVQLPELFHPKWESYDTSVVHLDQLLTQESQYIECPLPQNPELAMKFSPENQNLLAKLDDDPYFFDVFGLADEPEIGNTSQFPIEQVFPESGIGKNRTMGGSSKNVDADDASFDGIFDNIEPLPDPLDW